MSKSSLTSWKSGMIWATALSCVLVVAGTMQAQPLPLPPPLPDKTPTIPPPPSLQAPVAPAANESSNPLVDPAVQQTSGCCGLKAPSLSGLGYGYHGGGGGGCGAGGCGAGGGGQCVPGRICHGCGDRDTICGRILGCLYDELCCPDPCYEPCWIPEANAAFWQDGPRPITQTRIRWDEGRHYQFPDSGEFFWAKIGGKGPKNTELFTNYAGLSFYQEVAAKGFSFFIELPYLSIDPFNNPGASGFSDMNIGTKSVLLDRELLLVTFQFRTFIPTGNFTTGLGTGHVSLEPALLAALKVTQSTYIQMQVADWIPLGGTGGFEGNVIHYHVSLNQRLCHLGDCFNITGTMELNGYSFRGEFTDLGGATPGLSGNNYVNAGPGIRIQFCERVDFGTSVMFGFASPHGPEQVYRTEFRLRF